MLGIPARLDLQSYDPRLTRMMSTIGPTKSHMAGSSTEASIQQLWQREVTGYFGD